MKSSNGPSSSIGIRFVIPTGRAEEDDDERDASMLNSASYSRVPLQSLEDSVEFEITIVGGRPCASKLGGCGCGGGGGGGGGGGATGPPAPVNVPEDGGAYGNTASLRCIVGASRNDDPDPDAGPPLVPAIERRPLLCPAPTSSSKLSTKLMLELVLMLESEPCPRNNDTNPNGCPLDPSVPPSPTPAVGRDEDNPG